MEKILINTFSANHVYVSERTNFSQSKLSAFKSTNQPTNYETTTHNNTLKQKPANQPTRPLCSRKYTNTRKRLPHFGKKKLNNSSGPRAAGRTRKLYTQNSKSQTDTLIIHMQRKYNWNIRRRHTTNARLPFSLCHSGVCFRKKNEHKKQHRREIWISVTLIAKPEKNSLKQNYTALPQESSVSKQKTTTTTRKHTQAEWSVFDFHRANSK